MSQSHHQTSNTERLLAQKDQLTCQEPVSASDSNSNATSEGCYYTMLVSPPSPHTEALPAEGMMFRPVASGRCLGADEMLRPDPMIGLVPLKGEKEIFSPQPPNTQISQGPDVTRQKHENEGLLSTPPVCGGCLSCNSNSVAKDAQGEKL